LAHASQPIPVIHLIGIEPFAVVSDNELQMPVLDVKGDIDPAASCVASCVVDSLFENQKHLSPHVGADFPVLKTGRPLKTEFHFTPAKDIARKPPHAIGKIAQMIPLGVNGPDNVIH